MTFSIPTLACLGLALPLAAHAEVCVSVDTQADTLNPEERKAAVLLARGVFEDAGESVVDAPCQAEYRLSNVRLGTLITARISGPKGTSKGQAQSLEELGAVYARLIPNLLSSEAEAVSAATSTKQSAPRVRERDVWYMQIGGGRLISEDAGMGVVRFGMGNRIDMSANIALDFSGRAIFDTGSEEDNERAGAGALDVGVRAMGLFFLNDRGDGSPFAGAGLGYNVTFLEHADESYSGHGLTAELSMGYALFRTSRGSVFAQLDATLPLYSVETDQLNELIGVESEDTLTQYAPTVTLSLGFGFDTTR
ncbi:MAG: hypothetical protein ACE366_24170 [Bradymonadia bacterium]